MSFGMSPVVAITEQRKQLLPRNVDLGLWSVYDTASLVKWSDARLESGWPEFDPRFHCGPFPG